MGPADKEIREEKLRPGTVRATARDSRPSPSLPLSSSISSSCHHSSCHSRVPWPGSSSPHVPLEQLFNGERAPWMALLPRSYDGGQVASVSDQRWSRPGVEEEWFPSTHHGCERAMRISAIRKEKQWSILIVVFQTIAAVLGRTFLVATWLTGK